MSKKDKNKNNPEEEMSLADLLGGDSSDDSDSAPERVTDKRDDEPGSGMIKLSSLVADSSPEQAKTPSIIPPMAIDATPTGGVPIQTGAAMAPAQQPKSNTGLILAVVAIICIAGLAGFYMYTTSQKNEAKPAAVAKVEPVKTQADEKTEQQMKAMAAKLEAMEKKSEEDAKKKAAELAAAAAVATAADTGVNAVDTGAAEEPKEEDDKPKKATGKKGGSKPKAKTDTPKGKTDINDLVDKKKDTKKDAKKDEPKTKTSDLDSLLGGGKPKKDDAKPKTKADTGGLPTTPSRADVKTAMGPVGAKAQAKCAKFSTGTIQLKIVVGNNGRVKSSAARPPFAGTPAGKCAAMMARTAKFPKFKNASFSFTYPLTLR